MFSYRHGFHAGNHADLLKHLVLVHILQYFNQKEVPYSFIDLHAGAGLYDLQGDWAQKNGEFASGIGKLWDTKKAGPPMIEAYLEVIRNVGSAAELPAAEKNRLSHRARAMALLKQRLGLA